MKRSVFTFLTVVIALMMLLPNRIAAQDSKLAKQKMAAKTYLNTNISVFSAALNANLSYARSNHGNTPPKNEGMLGKAIAYHKKAKELYAQNKYEKAILHGMKARKLALIVMMNCKVEIRDQFATNVESLFHYFDRGNDPIFIKKIDRAIRHIIKPELDDFEGELEQGIGESAIDPPTDQKSWIALEKTFNVQ